MKPPGAAIVFLLILGSCGGEKPQGRAPTPQGNTDAVTVETVRPVAAEEFWEAVGTVRSRKTAILSSKAVGVITAIPVNEGDKVTRGETLVEIDSRDLRADLTGAEAAAEEAEWALKAAESAVTAAGGRRDFAAATFKRYESLLSKGSVTPQEFDDANAKFKVANAEVAQAEQNLRAAKSKGAQARARVTYSRALLSYARVAAPFDGVVTSKPAEVGALASPGSALLTIEELGRYRLEAQVGESSLGLVHLGSVVPVRVDALDKEISGTITEIVPAADPQTRTFTVKIELAPDLSLHSGLYAKARIHSEKKKALLVPERSIVRRGQLVAVYVVDPAGSAQLRLVTAGKRYGEKREILSGLDAGERVVVEGAQRVTDGMRLGAARESH